MNIGRKMLFTAATATGLLGSAALANAESPKTAENDSWISVSGTIVSTTPDAFRLDYAGGVITVEMDDFDFFKEGRALLENDKVVVYGKIDDGLFEKRTIEASSVYVENLNTYFRASAVDEEDFSSWTVSSPIVVGKMELTGTVTSIKDREFTVNTGLRKIRVDTWGLPYNPMDDKGYLKIDVGDLVKVHGDVEVSLFESKEVDADWITELQ